MSTAEFELSISIDCENKDIIEMLKVFRAYTTGDREAYFNFVEVVRGETDLDIESASDEDIEDFVCENEGEISISGIGPFGHYGELNDVDVFREMAEAAPEGWFEADINGCTTYTEQTLHCELKDSKLSINTFYEANEERFDAYSAYIEDALPYLVFIRLFRIAAEEFDESDYADFISCTLSYENDGFKSLEYEGFIEEFEGITDITSEEFDANIAVINSLGIMSYQDFVFENEDEFGAEEELVYDPIAKSYIGLERPIFKSNTVYNVNDLIKTYLASIGQPNSDEDIAALSVDDVYSILAGTYGKDSAAPIAESIPENENDFE